MTYTKHFGLAQIAILLTATLGLTAQAVPSKTEPAAALVTELSGSASYLLADSAAPHKMRVYNVKQYDWLPVHATLQVPADSNVEVMFASGKRYEIRGAAKVKIAAEPVAVSVRMIELPQLPQTQVQQRLAGIADMEKALASASTGVRAQEIVGLYPAELSLDHRTLDAASLPDHTVLRFAPDQRASSYRVAIEDESGSEIFQSEVESHEVAIRPGVLLPGHRYSWTVKASLRQGQSPEGRANFSTLNGEQIAQRAAWLKAWEESKNPDLLVAMAEIDFHLGLFAEANDEMTAALEMVQQAKK